MIAFKYLFLQGDCKWIYVNLQMTLPIYNGTLEAIIWKNMEDTIVFWLKKYLFLFLHFILYARNVQVTFSEKPKIKV